MNNLKIFENAEFGQIRTVTVNDVVYFIGKDVATVLGYSNTRDALTKRVDDEDKIDGVAICDSIGREQKPTLINESGLYSLVLSSKLPNAKKFKRWITSEVLPAIRQNGFYYNGLSTEMKAIIMHDKKLVQINERLDTLENTMTIDFKRQRQLEKAVNKVVIEALGGKESLAYKRIARKVFAECNRDIKDYFQVNSRNDIAAKDFEKAVLYIAKWKPCTNTLMEIDVCNRW